MRCGAQAGLLRARQAETVAGGNLPWFLPRSSRPSPLLCVSLPQTPPQEAPKSNCGPTAIWMSFALRELWELPAWLGALHPQPSPSGEWPVGLC